MFVNTMKTAVLLAGMGGLIVTPDNAYNTVRELEKSVGFRSKNYFFTDPEGQMPEPQPDPAPAQPEVGRPAGDRRSQGLGQALLREHAQGLRSHAGQEQETGSGEAGRQREGGGSHDESAAQGTPPGAESSSGPTEAAGSRGEV